MKIVMELHDDNPMQKVRSIKYEVKEGLFTRTYHHTFRDGELPDPNMAVNILLTAMPDNAY